jgi:hypothetical protein
MQINTGLLANHKMDCGERLISGEFEANGPVHRGKYRESSLRINGLNKSSDIRVLHMANLLSVANSPQTPG